MKPGLAKDKADEAKLRHGRSTNDGCLPSKFVGSYFPHLFTREGAALSLNGIYRGSSAFIIAGGPSFASIDTALLRGVWTMTLNNASKSFRSQANCIVDEPSRFSYSMWLDPTIQKFVPMAHFEKPLWDNRLMSIQGTPQQKWEKATLRVGDCPNVVGYRRNEKFHPGRFLHEDTINWGNHARYGGGRSVLLAALRILYIIGFRRVYLLGVDFEMSLSKKYHFDEERSPASIKGNNITYARLQMWLAALQPYFLKAGYIVRNCNLESKLLAFPKMSFEEAIQEATAGLGDFMNERTLGMYVKAEEKFRTGSSTGSDESGRSAQ